VGPRADLEAVAKRKIPAPPGNRAPVFPAGSPDTILSYPASTSSPNAGRQNHNKRMRNKSLETVSELQHLGTSVTGQY